MWNRIDLHNITNFFFLEGYEFSSNIYAIVDDEITFIDAGNDYTAFYEFFELGFDPFCVRGVILTHSHIDHSAGVYELLRYESIRKNIQIILHENGSRTLMETAQKLGAKVVKIKGFEKIDAGQFRIFAIPTPGHTGDSMCLYIPDLDTIFTGDTVLPNAIAAPDPFVGGNLKDYVNSLRLLRSLKVKNCLPGHGKPIVGNGAKSIEETYEGVIMNLTDSREYDEIVKKLISLGYLEDAIIYCDKILEKREDLEIMLAKASSLIHLYRCEEAIEILNKVLKMDSKNHMALISMGYALMLMKKYFESIEFFDKALKIRYSPEARIYKGIALTLMGKFEEAMKIPEFKENFEKFKSLGGF
uniref:MBL fold metallo-hydrolase n=1 Tax=Archaeoglobus fulgidus TaxID=2234 RepID=A0A7J3M037_ARCFL